MAKRRKRGEGSITLRTDGRYEVRITDPVSGRRRSIFVRTEDEATAELKQAHKDIDDGAGIGDRKVTVATYFYEWLAGVKPTLRATTFARYQSDVERHIIPNIGRVKLRRLSPVHLRKLYAELAESGQNRKKGLSPRSVGHVHRVIHAALEKAAADDLAPRNVARMVSPPATVNDEAPSLNEEEVRALLTAAEGDRLEALYVLAVTVGARQGELLALRWDDLDGNRLSIRRNLVQVKGELHFQEPKTKRSRRRVALPAAAADALREHRKRQNKERLKAVGWDDHDLIFPNEIGRPMNPSNFHHRSWRPLRERAGLPDGFTFHGLRHTCASLSLAEGVPVPDVSAMLGHENPSITMRIYAHVIPDDQSRTATAMDAILSRSV